MPEPPQMVCTACAAQAPTKYVEFYQNIGMLVTRQWAQIKGNLCRRCIGAYFRSYTSTTLFLGWWGLISFIVTPFVLVNNVVRYLAALNLPEPGIAAMNTPSSSISTPISVSTHSRNFKVIYGAVVGAAILAAVAYSSVDFVEKHAPSVNAAMHNGKITDESDGRYAGLKVGEDIVALTATTKSTDWAGLRSEFLSREPYLNDLKVQNDRIQSSAGTDANSTNDLCDRIALSQFVPALGAYTIDNVSPSK